MIVAIWSKPRRKTGLPREQAVNGFSSLTGLAFGSLYALIALGFLVEPSSFELTPLDLDGDVRTVFARLNGRFSYFSFITLTTVGYGDITPASALAKQVAVLEGLVGQLYPAILLARLVAMQLTSRSE